MNAVPPDVPLTAWSPPPETPVLEAGAVHVWRAPLLVAASTIHGLQQDLTADETTRAERFRFRADRERFIVARGVLRSILGRYLGVEPGLLRFRHGPYGKPLLAAGFGQEGLRFNLSHARDLALYAVAHDREVGVDTEWINPDFPGLEVAEHVFAPREVAALRSLSADRRHETFFTWWTLKEAYLKARGDGLALRPDQIDVSSAPAGSAGQWSAPDASGAGAPWSLQSFVPAPGYVAALAVAGPVRRVDCWQWPRPEREGRGPMRPSPTRTGGALTSKRVR